MDHLTQNYDANRDLYLEILKKAEKEADQALIQMIARKLKNSLQHPDSTQDGCRIFAFPAFRSPTAGAENSESLFWKDGQFWQSIVQLIAFLGLAVCYFYFFGRIFFVGI